MAFLVDGQGVGSLGLAGLPEKRGRHLGIALPDENAPRLLEEGRYEMRHRTREPPGEPGQVIPCVPGRVPCPAFGVPEFHDEIQGLPGVGGVVGDRPGRETDGGIASEPHGP